MNARETMRRGVRNQPTPRTTTWGYKTHEDRPEFDDDNLVRSLRPAKGAAASYSGEPPEEGADGHRPSYEAAHHPLQPYGHVYNASTAEIRPVIPRVLLWLVLGVVAAVGVTLAVWYFAGAESRRVAQVVADKTPDQVTRLLLDGTELPASHILEVGGLLDKRVGLVEYVYSEGEEKPTVLMNSPYGHDGIQVYGLLYPADSLLTEVEPELREHGSELASAIQRIGDEGFGSPHWDQAASAHEMLLSEYEGAMDSEVILVKLRESDHPELFTQLREIARIENAPRRLDGATALMSAGIDALLANPEMFTTGVFTVETAEQNLDVAQAIQTLDMFRTVNIMATVTLVE